MCFLATPSTRYRESFLRAAAEFSAEGRLDSTYAGFLGYDLKKLARRFDDFVRELVHLGEDSHSCAGSYPDKVFWLIAGEEYLGQVSIRPELGTLYLITYGGHIGYSIRPDRRRRGYGRKILALALEKARELKLRKILITCDEDNISSRKIIEANGGRFERAMLMEPDILRAEGRAGDGPLKKLRYWIELA